jgi:hypothetical protein
MSRTAKAVWVGLAVAIWGISVYFWLWYPFEEVDRSAGTFATRETAVKGSIHKLAQEMRRRPTTQKYTIWFHLAEPDRSGGGGATIYERRQATVGWVADPTSAWMDYWTNVDDATIHAVAATNGTFESLGKAANAK